MTDHIFETPASTPNFRNDLAAQLAQLVPEAIADGKVDIEKLRELLSDDVADSSERFGLFWPGKKKALRAAQEPTTATLKPDFENSKDWETTKNVFIEGDNLEVLKILQKHYHAKIKMIYIDPPYNTGKEFVYPDNYKEGLDTYLEWTRQVNEEGKRLSPNAETEGRYHSNWLNMMYPRLKLARNLLSGHGAIFVSIDDSEIENLKRVMNEVFGEVNFVGSMVWAAGRKNDSKYISSSHEYILCYARDAAALARDGVTWKIKKKGLSEIQKEYARLRKLHGDDYPAVEKGLKRWYSGLPDSDPSKRQRHYSSVDARGIYFPSDLRKPEATSRSRYDIIHPVTRRPVNMHPNGWSFAPERMEKLLAEDRIKFGADETTRPTLKVYLMEADAEAAYSVFYQDGRGASRRLTALMGAQVFDYPKDETVIETLVEMATSAHDTVLDFFSGSATTGHAVMAANAKDGGQRHYIQVQLPEPTPMSSVARASGFDDVAQIGRERLRRAVTFLETQGSVPGALSRSFDGGYRAYVLAESSFVKWRGSGEVDVEALSQHLFDLRNSSDDEAKPDDLLTEILLKQGYSLTETIREAEVAGLNVRQVLDADGDVGLLAYLDEHVKPTLNQLRAFVDAYPTRLVVLEDAFDGDDELKTNLAQLAKSRGVEFWTA